MLNRFDAYFPPQTICHEVRSVWLIYERYGVLIIVRSDCHTHGDYEIRQIYKEKILMVIDIREI